MFLLMFMLISFSAQDKIHIFLSLLFDASFYNIYISNTESSADFVTENKFIKHQ